MPFNRSNVDSSTGRGPQGNDTRLKAILGTVITAFVLAGVIFFLWSFSSPQHKDSPSTTIKLSPSQQSDRQYQRGLRSLESSDTTGAIQAFKSALQIDPSNASAQAGLKKATDAQKAKQDASSGGSSSSSSGGSGDTPPPGKKAIDYTQQVDPLSSLLPPSFASFELGAPTTSGGDSTRAGSPTDASGSVTRILWTVHYFSSQGKAEDFLKNVTKTLYAQGSKSVSVNGTSAYFGTDGGRYASVAYQKKNYVFEVVLTSSGDPGDAQSTAVAAATAFPVE